MMDPDSNDQEDDSWSRLSSINQFDRYSDGLMTSVGSTQIVGGNLIESVTSKATTPVSLLVECLVQQMCTMSEPDPVRSKKLYNTICSHLHQMNMIDNTYDMGEFDLMRNQYQQALYQLVSVARGQDLPPQMQSVWPLTLPLGKDWSRYYREFEELDFIAGGGFGKVYQARHKLDRTVYAIKKITIKKTDVERVLTHLAEVKTLASLHHINVVPYKAAWLEPLLVEPNEHCNIENTCTRDDENSMSATQASASKRQNESSEFVTFERSRTMSDADDVSNTEGTCNTDGYSIVSKYSRQIQFNSHEQPHLRLRWATLFIQMALCQLTLREWLDNRNKAESFESFYKDFIEKQASRATNTHRQRFFRRKSSSSSTASSSSASGSDGGSSVSHMEISTNIMTQLLNGLAYIHSRNIIHHDIKPSNIFIGVEQDGRIIVQLGDFGLACPQEDKHTEVIAGTPTYAAPEQLNGICNPKSGIYSLGIVLIELLVGFNTDMERIRTIEAARSGQISDKIPDHFSSLIKSMLRYKPSKRPDVSQAIEMMNNLTDTVRRQSTDDLQQQVNQLNAEITQLRTKIKTDQILDIEIHDREREIRLKNEELQVKNREIEMLQRQIMEMETRTSELVSKDEEINRLTALLSVYQSKVDL